MRPIDDRIRQWLRSESGQLRFDVDAAWGRFAASNDLTDVRPLRRRPLTLTWQIAAAALVVISAGVWSAVRVARSSSALVVATPNGERRTVALGDGSTATLNGGSRLRYSPAHREASIEGEALFEIHHDSAHPFTVHARRGVIRDVGTRFTVRSYDDGGDVAVAVMEGAVRVEGDSAPAGITLGANQRAFVDQAGRVRRDDHAIDNLVGWVSGDLVLDDVTLADAARQLERTYGARVTVGDSSLARRRVTARFHRETLARALDGIALALGASWERGDSTYVIHSRGSR